MKFKFNNLIAFTLSEMMIVLLIVSVISAATIPTITQQKQKPYNISDNNSTASVSDIWKQDDFSGIFSAFSLNDNEQSVVVNKDTKSETSVQRLYGDVVPSLYLKKDLLGYSNGNYDSGQIKLYKKNNYVGNVGIDGNSSSISIGYATRTSATNKNIRIGYYANYAASQGNVYNNPQDIIAIGTQAMYDSFPGYFAAATGGKQIGIGTYAGYYANKVDSICIGAYAGSTRRWEGIQNSNKLSTEYMTVNLGFYAGNVGYASVGSDSENKRPMYSNISIGAYAGNYVNAVIKKTNNAASCIPCNKISIGAYSGLGYTNADTISIGYYAGATPKGVWFYNDNMVDPIHDNDIAIGYYSHYTSNVSSWNNAEAYSQNIFIGSYAGLESAYYTREAILIGKYAGGYYFSANDPPAIAIGYYASNYKGGISLGTYAGIVSGDHYSIMVGRYAGYGSTNSVMGWSNIYIGRYAGYMNTGGAKIGAIAIGNEAGYYTSIGGKYYRGEGLLIGYGAFSGYSMNGTSYTSDDTMMILPYASKSIVSDTGDWFTLTAGNFGSMVIGPGYGYPGGPSFNNTILVLYASYIEAPSATFSPFTSDRRSKENIVKSKYGIEQFRHINTYTYNFKFDPDKNAPRIGVIAQEVQKYIPEAIVKSADGTLNVDFDWILYPLANAIKDVDENLTQLKNDLIAQAKDLVLLEKRVDKLDKKITKTLEKQSNMQDKLNATKDILNKMETK